MRDAQTLAGIDAFPGAFVALVVFAAAAVVVVVVVFLVGVVVLLAFVLVARLVVLALGQNAQVFFSLLRRWRPNGARRRLSRRQRRQFANDWLTTIVYDE